MRFDARAAKLLKPGQHMVVEGANGLRLVCSTTGRSWIYRFKNPADGLMKQVKVGEWPAMSVAAAVSELERLRAVREEGRNPAQEKRAAKQAEKAHSLTLPQSGMSVASLMEDFADHVAGKRKPKGVAELRRLSRTMLGDVGELKPEQVTRAIAYALISRHSGTPVVALNLRRELGSAWDWAHDSGRLSEDVPNWWRVILRGKLKSAGKIVDGQHQGVVKRWLTPQEVGEVLRMLPHVSRLVGELIVLYLWTGCRGAEIVAMEGREVGQEPDGWWWTIPRSKLKVGDHPLAVDLRVPLMGRALEIVRARMDAHGQGHLFPARHGRARHSDQRVVGIGVYWHSSGCTLRPESPRPRWPIPSWAPHDLRRTVRTQLAALGCHEAVAEAIIGHIKPGVVGVYDRHTYDVERREWLAKVIAVWEAAVTR